MRYVLPITFLLVPFRFLYPGTIQQGHLIAFFIAALSIFLILIVLGLMEREGIAHHVRLYDLPRTL